MDRIIYLIITFSFIHLFEINHLKEYALKCFSIDWLINIIMDSLELLLESFLN